LQRLEKKTTISDYDKQYANGPLNKDFLREYISLRRNTGITTNAALIEEYVKFLTVRELDNPEEILFILRAGPLVYGKAYGLARNNKKISNEAFMALPLQERIDMNSVMLENTLNEAIAKKNYQMALQVSNFARSTHTNQREGQRQAAWKMLVYWKAVGDTSNYFNQAIRYNDTYFMTVGMDSINKAKADNFKNMELIKNFKKTTPNFANAIPAGRITDPSRITVTRRIVTVVGNGNNVSNSLNTAAWDFYTMGTRNSNYLSKALLWSKRSIEMDPMPAYYDTLAHIFYRMGLYDEALLNQNKSIELSDTKPEYKSGIANLKLELNKMKERTL
jgi:tetratricopeptide (TPR) repeat protein